MLQAAKALMLPKKLTPQGFLLHETRHLIARNKPYGAIGEPCRHCIIA
jgi:hypothetical protein